MFADGDIVQLGSLQVPSDRRLILVLKLQLSIINLLMNILLFGNKLSKTTNRLTDGPTRRKTENYWPTKLLESVRARDQCRKD